jgi:protein-S-isoprenylcysteine O-methyltransferase Ste14
MDPFTRYLAVVATVILGSVSLLMFGLFLVFGPFGVVDLGLGQTGVLVVDGGLCLLFCIQHSVMIRRVFRDHLGRFLPAVYHGALYTAASGIALIALVVLWQESPITIYDLQGPARITTRLPITVAMFLVLWGARVLHGFDVFGTGSLRARVFRISDTSNQKLTIRGPYRWVRHPMYLAVLIVLWSCPDLTADRLLMNVLLTAWLWLGTILEERDLAGTFGLSYRDYQKSVPMLLPRKIPSK